MTKKRCRFPNDDTLSRLLYLALKKGSPHLGCRRLRKNVQAEARLVAENVTGVVIPGKAIEIAKAVVFPASDDSSYITGAELFVDDGMARMWARGDQVMTPITTLFLDIGGVLLTNGWDRRIRRLAAETFNLDFEEMDERHHLTFDTYEEGKVTLGEYLDRVVFYRERTFTRDQFQTFMFAQSRPFPEMIELVCRLKSRYRLKVVAVSNEGRELNVHRIGTFKLETFIDFFVSSCFVHFRKPDADIFRIALDIAQVTPEQAVYIEDRPMFVEVAQALGISGIIHAGHDTTQKELKRFGLIVPG